MKHLPQDRRKKSPQATKILLLQYHLDTGDSLL